MKRNKFDIILNWLILICLLYLLVSGLISLFEPVFYSRNTVGKKEPTDDEYINAMAATYGYFELYKEKKYDAIDEALAYTIKEDEYVYKQYYKKVSLWKEDELNITNIKKKGSNKFIVEYSVNAEENNKLVIKIDEDSKTYKIFYDSKLESF